MQRTNAELVRELIAKHGVDRYPTAELNALKMFEEAGEMVRHLLRGEIDQVGAELADVAISLYALADKLQLDLDVEIVGKVDGDARRFA